MAKQLVNVGSGPNQKDGDTTRNAWVKSNSNFSELYNKIDNIEEEYLKVHRSDGIQVNFGSSNTLSADVNQDLSIDGLPIVLEVIKSDQSTGVAISLSGTIPSASSGNGLMYLKRSMDDSSWIIVHSFIVSEGNVSFVFEDTLPLLKDQKIEYKLTNATNDTQLSGSVPGTVAFNSYTGFSFTARETTPSYSATG